MNNSRIALDTNAFSDQKPVDIRPQLREREEKLVKIIEAIRGLKQTAHWSTLKTELFDSLEVSLRRDLLREAKKDNRDITRLDRLAGQLIWAERYANLDKLEEAFKVELSGLKQKLHEQHG